MGGLGGQKCKSLENLPNGWTDWHQIWYTSADSYGNGHRLKTNSPSSPGVILEFRWSKCNQKFEECHDLQIKMKIIYIKMKCTNRHNYAATIPGEAG